MRRIFVLAVCVACVLTFALSVDTWAQDKAQTKTLSNTFKEPNLGYSISYPADWTYTFQAPHIVAFGARKSGDGDATISIRNLNSAKTPGGRYKDVDGVMEGLMNAFKNAKDVVVYNPEPFAYSKGQTKLAGKQMIAEYTLQGEKYKQLLVVVPRSTGDVFHVFSFVSKAKSYDKNVALAQAMLGSWTIQ